MTFFDVSLARGMAGASEQHGAIPASPAMAMACLVTYWLTVHRSARIHSVSLADNVLGGIWAVITAFE
jgi:hypothetical protein